MGTITPDHMLSFVCVTLSLNTSCWMGDVVNLRTERKRAARLQASKEAGHRRLEHGVAKQQRMTAKAVEHKASRKLDQQRLDSGETQ
jgi:hypothetical protein